MTIGTCKYVNADIKQFFIAEWNNSIVPIYSSNNVISGYQWINTPWYEIRLNTAVITYSQELDAQNPNGNVYDEKISVSIPRADNDKWKNLVNLLTDKYIVVFQDANDTWFTFGYRYGATVRSYILSENQYVISFDSPHATNLPTLIDDAYVLNNIYNTPTPSPSSSVPPSTPSRTPTHTPTPSLTPTRTLTPTPTPSMVIYTKCADNGFHFNGYSTGQLGTLTVGDVHITTGTLTDYVIEWHLNSPSGSTVFVTGNSGNTDPSIQAFHPLVSELVQSGTLYPVIRYANVNGVLYSSYSNLGYLYSPDLLTCLPSISVASMSCSNGATGSTFGHTITYNNSSQPSQLANRSFTYTLNYDGSSKEISYQFYGYLIADRITLTYCTTGGTTTVMDDWVVGTDSVATDFNVTPKIFDNQYIKRTLSLTGFTYQSGDYLLFDTFPSYNAPGNTDTNWQLSIKCWSGTNLMNFGFQPNTSNDINTGATMTLVYNTGNCSYDVLIETGAPETPYSYNTDMYNYTMAGAGGSYDWNTGQTVQLLNYTGSSVSWAPPNGYGTPYLLNGVLNIKLTGGTNNLVYTFTDAIDYNHYKTGYTTNITNSNWTNWTSDVHSINHYKWFYDVFRVSMTSGDTTTTYQSFIDHEAVFTFDDTGKTISVALAYQDLQYTGVTCDKTADGISYWNNQINQLYSGTTWNLNTIWGTQFTFPFLYTAQYLYRYTGLTMQTYMFIQDPLLDPSTPLSPEWYYSGGNWFFYKIYVRVYIDNVLDPLNNYRIWNGLNSDGSLGSPVVWTLIKQVP